MQNSLLSNIKDDGDNNDKTKNLKTRVGILGGNFPGEDFPGGSLMGEIFRVEVFLIPMKLYVIGGGQIVRTNGICNCIRETF